jgi:hypothetical protein
MPTPSIIDANVPVTVLNHLRSTGPFNSANAFSGILDALVTFDRSF